MSFSSLQRQAYIQNLKTENFDLLVIGGGITGAGIALDAAVRGLKVALVEKNDFASGTSSRSTKLIHGGLRYLKQLEVKLVREVGKERATVYNNAPHIVIPEKMLLPIVKKGSLGKYSSSLGLYVYDRLADVEKKERRKMMSRSETIKKEPLLRRDILLGGGLYIEYRSDDARLVIENMKAAVERGATCLNYAQLKECTRTDGKVSGAIIQDGLTGETFEVKAKTIINAAGPWVDDVRKKEGSLQGKHLLLTKGVHIVVSKKRLPLNASVYFDVSTDNRMIFAIPRGKVVYIGTTDTVYPKDEDVNFPFADMEDATYILKAANFMFPEANLTIEDIESTWAGLRPLIYEEGKDPSEVSRKDEIFITDSKLISIAGGKLTGYRKMAERAVDEAFEQLKHIDGRKQVKCTTKKVTLSGGDLKGHSGVVQFVKYLQAQYPDFAPERIEELVYKYGTSADEIMDAAKKINAQDKLLLAEMDYCIEEESVVSVSDFLIRRTGRLFFDRPSLADKYKMIHEYICEKCGHTKEISDQQLAMFEKEYFGVVAFKSLIK